eukprot:2975553-Amphidinium_carterae.1
MDVEPIHIPPPPGLDNPIPHPDEAIPRQPPEAHDMTGDTIVDMEVDRPTEVYKPTHRLTGKQSPPKAVRAIVAQLDNIADAKEITLEKNEDKEEKRRMESIMSDYEDDITMFSEHAAKDAMNKELSQLINKKSFVKVDKRSLTAEQLQHVVATRWVITTRPSNSVCGKGFSQFIHDTDTQTFAATPSSLAMRLLLTIAIIKKFTVFTTEVPNAFLNTPMMTDQ